jgi:hypothetical protein
VQRGRGRFILRGQADTNRRRYRWTSFSRVPL